MPTRGEAAPALKGKAVTGETVDIRDFRPRSVIVEFFRGTW